MELGFLGLGQMGAAIAERLQDAGAVLHLFDPNKAALTPFVAKGARVHASPTGVADSARIVFACLPSPAICESVARDVAAGSAVRPKHDREVNRFDERIRWEWSVEDCNRVRMSEPSQE